MNQDHEFSDESMSELAEALEDACQEIIRFGHELSSQSNRWNCYCPLGALFRPRWDGRVVRRPGQDIVPLPPAIAAGFGFGFDGLPMQSWYDPRAYELGKLFREKYS